MMDKKSDEHKQADRTPPKRKARRLVLGIVAGLVLLVLGTVGWLASGILNQSYTAFDERFTTGTVTSADGTTISYRQIGEGPGLVMVHGGMASAQSFIDLAESLSDDFTVYLYDGRGRGQSGPFGENHSIDKAVEDLDAVLTETGAHNVFGVSVGGLTTLHAARSLPAIEKAALYEPGLSIDGSTPLAWVEEYEREMAEGDVAEALIIGLKGAKMGPPDLLSMPNWQLESMTSLQMFVEDRRAPAGYLTWRELAPTLGPDTKLLVEMSERPDGKLETFKSVPAEVLLLGGSESAAYQKTSLDALEQVLPNVRRVEFQGLDHDSSGNASMGGQPKRLVQELRQFFASP